MLSVKEITELQGRLKSDGVILIATTGSELRVQVVGMNQFAQIGALETTKQILSSKFVRQPEPNPEIQ